MTLLPHGLIAAVALERLFELWLSRRNTARLLAAGAYEVGASHYPLIVILHVAWIASLWLAVPADAVIAWPWLGLYALLECGRGWVMITLGRYWTTRIIHLPNAPLVVAGPYRFFRHPNYVIVAGEIAVLPMVFGEWQIAVVFSILNAGVLVWRISIENGALATRPRIADQ